MAPWPLTVDILDGPVPWAVWSLSGVALLVLVLRRPRRRWIVPAAIGVVAGAVFGWGLVKVLDLTDAFGTTLPTAVHIWATVGFACLGLAISALREPRRWRKAVAGVAILGTLLSMFLGINEVYGLDRTPADLLGINMLPELRRLPAPQTGSVATDPLDKTWKAPADLPKAGSVHVLRGAMRIASTAGFVPRDASIYLPPAALVKDPPALPALVMMQGLPGSPIPGPLPGILDDYAARHRGLAPIVVVVDQLGGQIQNPGCVDSAAYGGVETYVNKDVPAFIRSHLRVLPDPAHWAIGGFSNGGTCAFLYGARHPDTWGSIASVSGEPWPGFENQGQVLGPVYHGDRAAFDANKPAAILAAHPGAYAGHVAIFTAGGKDPYYVHADRTAAALAAAAGFHVTFYEVPGADHVGGGLTGGLAEWFRVLGPRWGLEP